MEDKIITKFNLTGECEISVENVKKAWDKRWSISQWHNEYTLCHHNRNAENFTRTDIKVRISETQAKQVISDAKLQAEQSQIFRNAITWKRQPPTHNHMTQEQVNRILARLDGWELTNHIDKFTKDGYTLWGDEFKYTTDWNDFHRVWMKYLDDNDRCINATDSMLLLPFIYRHQTPLQAATRLAQIINDAAIH